MTGFSSRREMAHGVLGVIVLTGEVDIYTAPAFKTDLTSLIDEGARDVIVDLTAVEFIDSTALGVLISGLKRLHPVGGKMAVVADKARVSKIFTITGLDKVFDVVKTRREAENALAAKGRSR